MWVLRSVSGVVLGLVVFAGGCMPESKPPEATLPIDTETASKLQGRVRISNGERYTVEHQMQDRTFEAYWELGNALKKNSTLQIKPPGDWSELEVYQALEVVLAAHETKPWYSQIDDTVLRLFREAHTGEGNRATGYAPETPYDVAVKVNHYESEWFVEVKVQILDEDGMALGI